MSKPKKALMLLENEELLILFKNPLRKFLNSKAIINWGEFVHC